MDNVTKAQWIIRIFFITIIILAFILFTPEVISRIRG